MDVRVILRGLVAFFSFLLTVQQKLDHMYLVHQPIYQESFKGEVENPFCRNV